MDVWTTVWLVVSGVVGFISGAITIWQVTSPFIHFQTSWASIAKNSKNILAAMQKDNFRPDLIISAGRAGGILAALISGNIETKKVRILGVDMSYAWKDGARSETIFFPSIDLKGRKVLVTVGEVHTGKTLRELVDACKKNGAMQVKTAALFHSELESFPPDYVGGKLNKRKRMPWHFIPDYEKSSFPPNRTAA